MSLCLKKSFGIKFLAPHRSSLGNYTRVNACGEFLKIRNVEDREILKIYKLDENPPILNNFTNTLKTPSGEPKVGSGNFTVKK